MTIRSIRSIRSLIAGLAAGLVAACHGIPGDGTSLPPPRRFTQGGIWFPAATGYWFHQYAEREELETLLAGLGFACRDDGGKAGRLMHCERAVRAGRLFTRTDSARFEFRSNGVLESARSECRFGFLERPELSGACTPFAAPGAVYPDLATFSATVEAMLHARPMHEPISIHRLPTGSPAPLPDAQAVVDRLLRWRFDCEAPRQHYSVGFGAKRGEIAELVCRHASLRTTKGAQRQEVVVRYDSVELAVLGIAARLDDATAALSPAFHTPVGVAATKGSTTATTRASLVLETLAGERIEMPMSAVGTGSRQATREAFVTLTPGSQRALVQAYLDKRSREWSGRLEKLSYAGLGALEWFGPDALPHVEASMSDERVDVGAALVRYVCFEVAPRGVVSGDVDRRLQAMTACLDERRAALPASLAELDRLLARDFRDHATMDARAMNAFHDFTRGVGYVLALGRDAKLSRAALASAVEGKEEGLAPGLGRLVAAAVGGANVSLQIR